MATHSSVLAWRIPGTAEPGGLPSVGSHRVGHDWSDLAAAAASLYILNSIDKSDSECLTPPHLLSNSNFLTSWQTNECTVPIYQWISWTVLFMWEALNSEGAELLAGNTSDINIHRHLRSEKGKSYTDVFSDYVKLDSHVTNKDLALSLHY